MAMEHIRPAWAVGAIPAGHEKAATAIIAARISQQGGFSVMYGTRVY